MASRFDPSAFVEAERRERLATVATARVVPADGLGLGGSAENSPSAMVPARTIAESQQSQPAALGIDIWAQAPALLAALPRPPGVERARWDNLVRMTKWVTEDWAPAARSAGWHPLEFYGCNPDPYVGRLDRDGLVMLLSRSRSPLAVTGVFSDHVEIRSRGALMRYRPFGPRGQVYLWEAYATEGGP